MVLSTYAVVCCAYCANLLYCVALIEDLLLEDLVLDCVYCFGESLVLFSFLDKSPLHLLHGFLAFLDLGGLIFDLRLQLLYGDVKILNRLIQLQLVLLLLLELLTQFELLSVQFANPDLKLHNATLEPIVVRVFIADGFFEVADLPLALFKFSVRAKCNQRGLASCVNDVLVGYAAPSES